MSVGFIKKDLQEEVPLVPQKFTHALCIGQTGSGKTTSFIYPNLDDRMRAGHGLLVFDIKGNEHRAIKHLAQKNNRLEDVVEIGKPWGKKINAIASMSEREFEELLVGAIGDAKYAGSNAYFHSGAISLGLSIFYILKTYQVLDKEINIEYGGDLTLQYEKLSLAAIYKTSNSISAVYDFLDTLKENIDNLKYFIKEELEKDFEKVSNDMLFQNIILNYNYLSQSFHALSNYYIKESKRSLREHFDPSLISVINSLHQAFHFMSMLSSSYITETKECFDIVEALQMRKIIIINVRVIPDFILQIILQNIFENLINLNLKDHSQRTPVSIFIDEAQRLITKEIPLDVLRSSKTDVIMAIQSTFQLVSKFKNEGDWSQLSVNIGYKVAFKSPIYSSDMNNFFADTNKLETFEYVKEFENGFYLAKPMFLDEHEFKKADYAYQQDVLRIPYLEQDEYADYDVGHFEREREIIIKNTLSGQSRHFKLFSKVEKDFINNIIEDIKSSSTKIFFKNISDEYKIKKLPYGVFEELVFYYITNDIDYYESIFEGAYDSFALVKKAMPYENTQFESKDLSQESLPSCILDKYDTFEEIPEEDELKFDVVVMTAKNILRSNGFEIFFSELDHNYYVFTETSESKRNKDFKDEDEDEAVF